MVIEAAKSLGLPQDELSLLPGAAGQTWSFGEHILRVRPATGMKVEMAAWAAAASVVPTPVVIELAELGTMSAALGAMSAALVSRIPGTAAGDLAMISPERARKRGRACGRIHSLLSQVGAPKIVPPVPVPANWPGATPQPGGDRLLHLDLHPFNVLVDETDSVSGVVDWANAAAGDPDLDRARSASILALDPRAMERGVDPKWAALTRGWTESADLDDVPHVAMAWACHFMLDDLSSRYDRDQLAGVFQALKDAERHAPDSDQHPGPPA